MCKFLFRSLARRIGITHSRETLFYNGLIIAWQYDNDLSTHLTRQHRLADANFNFYIDFSPDRFILLLFVVVVSLCRSTYGGRYDSQKKNLIFQQLKC